MQNRRLLPRYANRSLKIESVAFIQAIIFRHVEEAAHELNFSQDTQVQVLDWCISEIYSRAFDKCGIDLTNHFRLDEGRLIMDMVDSKTVDPYIRKITQAYIPYKGAMAKLMVSGTNAIISVELP